MDDVTVSWIADANAERAARVANAFGIRHVRLTEGLKALPETDIMLLAIPYGAREPYYEVLTGRHTAVYVEKPFARTVAEHRRLCELFPAWRLACGLQRRSWGPALLLKQIIGEQMFGHLRSAQFAVGDSVIRTGGGYAADPTLAAGGRLLELGVHGVDLLLFVTQARTASVTSATMITDAGFDLDTRAFFAITGSDESTTECEIHVSSIKETRNGWRLNFDHATVTLGFDTSSDLQVHSASGRQLAVLQPSAGPFPKTAFQTFFGHWSEFVRGLRLQTPNVTAAVDSLLTTDVLETIYERGTPR